MTDAEIKESHHSMVETLVKPGEDILNGTSANLVHMLHMALGISGEASEIYDMFRHDRDPDLKNDFNNELALELGDIAFYAQGLMIPFHWTSAQVCTPTFDAEQVSRLQGQADMYGTAPKDLAPSELVRAAGTITEYIKKHWVYNKPLNTEDLRQALGLIVFLIRIIANGFGYSYADILRMNMEKLSKRYDGFSYSDKAAIERKDATS